MTLAAGRAPTSAVGLDFAIGYGPMGLGLVSQNFRESYPP